MKPIATAFILFLASITFAQEVVVKIKSLKCKPIVELNLNGKKTYFILDTGADISVLDLQAATHFGATLQKDYSGLTATGLANEKNKMMRVKNAILSLESNEMQARFYATDMRHIVEAVKERTNFEIAGIIGSDLMRHYGFVIDYKSKCVKIYLDKNLG